MKHLTFFTHVIAVSCILASYSANAVEELANFDPDTGIAIIPNMTVADDLECSYSIVLQQQEDKSLFRFITSDENVDCLSNQDPVDDLNEPIPFLDSPEPGSGIFGFEPNTTFPGQYFAPKLRERVLNYTDVKASFEEWNNLSAEEKKRTLYWQGSELLGEDEQGKSVKIDDLTNTFVSKRFYDGIGLTITEPLTATNLTSYPGCVGEDLAVNPRVCGEFNPKVLEGSEVFSQRWERLKNVDVNNDPLYASVADEDKGKIIYDLSAEVRTRFTIPDKSKLKVSLAFEISVSKIPGDFSDNACKPNNARQYNGDHRVRLTQVGLSATDPNLPAACKVDSSVLQRYYINVRAVNIDLEKEEINESLCTVGTGCKFEIVYFLD